MAKKRSNSNVNAFRTFSRRELRQELSRVNGRVRVRAGAIASGARRTLTVVPVATEIGALPALSASARSDLGNVLFHLGRSLVIDAMSGAWAPTVPVRAAAETRAAADAMLTLIQSIGADASLPPTVAEDVRRRLDALCRPDLTSIDRVTEGAALLACAERLLVVPSERHAMLLLNRGAAEWWLGRHPQLHDTLEKLERAGRQPDPWDAVYRARLSTLVAWIAVRTSQPALARQHALAMLECSARLESLPVLATPGIAQQGRFNLLMAALDAQDADESRFRWSALRAASEDRCREHMPFSDDFIERAEQIADVLVDPDDLRFFDELLRTTEEYLALAAESAGTETAVADTEGTSPAMPDLSDAARRDAVAKARARLGARP